MASVCKTENVQFSEDLGPLAKMLDPLSCDEVANEFSRNFIKVYQEGVLRPMDWQTVYKPRLYEILHVVEFRIYQRVAAQVLGMPAREGTPLEYATIYRSTQYFLDSNIFVSQLRLLFKGAWAFSHFAELKANFKS